MKTTTRRPLLYLLSLVAVDAAAAVAVARQHAADAAGAAGDFAVLAVASEIERADAAARRRYLSHLLLALFKKKHTSQLICQINA